MGTCSLNKIRSESLKTGVKHVMLIGVLLILLTGQGCSDSTPRAQTSAASSPIHWTTTPTNWGLEYTQPDQVSLFEQLTASRFGVPLEYPTIPPQYETR